MTNFHEKDDYFSGRGVTASQKATIRAFDRFYSMFPSFLDVFPDEDAFLAFAFWYYFQTSVIPGNRRLSECNDSNNWVYSLKNLRNKTNRPGKVLVSAFKVVSVMNVTIRPLPMSRITFNLILNISRKRMLLRGTMKWVRLTICFILLFNII